MRWNLSCPAATYNVKSNKVCSLSHSGMHANINTLVEFLLAAVVTCDNVKTSTVWCCLTAAILQGKWRTKEAFQ